MRSIKALSLTATIAAVALLSGCAGTVRNESNLNGSCFLDVTQPATDSLTGNNGASKVGMSTATTYLGWVALGDCSTAAAAKKAGITKISYIDYHSTNILGFIGTVTTQVYGE